MEETFAENFLEIVYSNIDDIRASREHVKGKENVCTSQTPIPQYFYGDSDNTKSQGIIIIKIYFLQI